MLLTLLACISTPLPETPILGGTPDQRAEVEAELAAFELASGGGRVAIREIRFEPSDALGRFNRLTHVVTLEEDLDPRDVGWVVRHELCHALDFAEDLARADTPWDALADEMFDPATGIVELEGPDARSGRTRRSEALAAFCSLGAVPARLLVEECPGDPPEGTTVARWLVDEVWWGPDETVEPDPPLASWRPGGVPEAIVIEGTGAPGVIRATATLEGRVAVEFLDLETGIPAARPPGIEAGEGDPEDLPVIAADGRRAVGPNGVGALLGAITLFHLGPSGDRLLRTDGERWIGVDQGCARTAQTVFVADGHAWTAWADGEIVRWSRLPSR